MLGWRSTVLPKLGLVKTKKGVLSLAGYLGLGGKPVTGSCEEIDPKDSIALLRNLRRPVHCMCDKRFDTAFSATGFH